jgi:hypothetical protein
MLISNAATLRSPAAGTGTRIFSVRSEPARACAAGARISATTLAETSRRVSREIPIARSYCAIEG